MNVSDSEWLPRHGFLDLQKSRTANDKLIEEKEINDCY